MTNPSRRNCLEKPRRDLSLHEYQRLCSEVPEEPAKRRLTDGEREDFARRTSLWDWFLQCQDGAWGKVGRKRVKADSTLTGYRDTLRAWCDYMRPTDLADDLVWPGLSLQVVERLSADQWQELVDAMDEDLSAAFVGRRWCELKIFLNHAVKANAIRHFAEPELPPEDDLKRVYTPDEVAGLWKLLAPHTLLRSAFVLSLNAGLRTNDLLCLPWSALQTDVSGRKVLDFKARKTGKHQRIPLAPVTLAAVECCRPLTGHTPWLFFGLTNPDAKYPDRTAFALARRELTRDIWTRAGIKDHKHPEETLRKPWQTGRATCATRYDRLHMGVGSFVLAHALIGVTARSYTEPTEMVWDAVLEVPQYECFKELLGDG